MTNLFSSIPLIGEDIVFRLWGGPGDLLWNSSFGVYLSMSTNTFPRYRFDLLIRLA